MSKSNHQKHNFHPSPKFMRKFSKDFVSISELKKKWRWNGDSPNSMFERGEIGSIESVRMVVME